MSYATVAEIESEFIDTSFGASTPITLTEVDEFCEDVSRSIDAKISNRYVVPVIQGDSPNAFTVIRSIVKCLVSVKVRRILNQDGGNTSEAALNLADKMKKECMAQLEDIATGKFDLEDAVFSSALSTSSFNQTNAIDPLFERDPDQW